MYLAIKEVKKEKLRFFMVIMVTVLIAYLVYFLTGLAYGLANANTTAVNYWDNRSIILEKSANDNIYASSIDEDVLKKAGITEGEKINLATTVVTVNKQKSKQYDLVLMGVEQPDSNVMSPLIEGREVESENEIVLSRTFKDIAGVKLNDQLKISSTGREFKIVGFTEKSEYNTQPVGYVNLEMASQAMMIYSTGDDEVDATTTSTPNMPNRVSAVVTNKKISKTKLEENNLQYLSNEEFINAIPGYQAQLLTFGLMIVSLIIIAAVIIGIFMYILTMQKKGIFAILKVQGISNKFISHSVVFQSILVSGIGVVIGLILTLVTAYFIPATVPIEINWMLMGIITALFVVCSLIGSIFSARSVLKIDPLEAL